MSDRQQFLSRFPIDVDSGASVDVSIESATEHVRLQAREGRLMAAVESRDPAADLVIQLGACAVGDLLLGKVATVEVFRDAELVDGDRRVSALPATEIAVAAEGRFEPIPGATLSVGMGVTSTIFGDVGVRELWGDGALTSSELVPMSELESSEVDVRMWCSLAQLAAIRRRELTPLDALASGVGLAGEWPQLMCFLELLQHPCYGPTWLAEPLVQAQIAWGSVFCSSAYGDAVRDAGARPEPAGVR